MQTENRGFTKKEAAALLVGIIVVVVMSVITTRVRPIPFPLNFLISLVLGSMAGFGTLKILDPRTETDRVEAATNVEFSQRLVELRAIVVRISQISQSPLLDAETSRHLANIASMVELITKRYKERSRDLAAASNLLTILRVFDPALTTYFKIKSGEQFMGLTSRDTELARTEREIIPMIEQALETWGQRLDSGEVTSKRISEGTLESMLRSLDLIEALKAQPEHPQLRKGTVDDRQ